MTKAVRKVTAIKDSDNVGEKSSPVVPVELAGKTYRLVFTFGSQLRISEGYRLNGRKYSLWEGFHLTGLDAVEFAVVFWSMLEKEHPEVSLPDAQALMDDPDSVSIIFLAASEAIQRSRPLGTETGKALAQAIIGSASAKASI